MQFNILWYTSKIQRLQTNHQNCLFLYIYILERDVYSQLYWFCVIEGHQWYFTLHWCRFTCLSFVRSQFCVQHIDHNIPHISCDFRQLFIYFGSITMWYPSRVNLRTLVIFDVHVSPQLLFVQKYSISYHCYADDSQFDFSVSVVKNRSSENALNCFTDWQTISYD